MHRASMRPRCASPLALAACLVVSLAGLSRGQGFNPAQYGQWAGPWQFDIPDQGQSDYMEIAHAATLPPPAGSPSMDRVFFIARRVNDCYALPGPGEERYVDGWVWRPRQPGNLERITNLNSAPDASRDPFCSGHTFLPDGSYFIAGGVDIVQKSCDGGCNGSAPAGPGHRATYRLDTSVDPPAWDASWNLTLNLARWYPTAISLANGDTWVGGHGYLIEPGNDCSPKKYENEGQQDEFEVLTDATYETLRWAPTPSFDPEVTSFLDTSACGVALESALAPMLAFPRVHMLSSRYLFQTDAPVVPGVQFGGRLMDIDPATILCGDGRWTLTGNPSNFWQPRRNGGGTVHLIFRDEGGFPVDVIYAIGGTDGNDDDNVDPGGTVYDSVNKIVVDTVDPLSAQWVGLGTDSPPNLNTKRYNHNTTIALDGSLIVNGGWHGEAPPFSQDVLMTERYRPPELFDVAEGSAQDVWKEMVTAVEPIHRRYHSVLVLLRDGRLVSAGGLELHVSGSEHSLDVYSPSYMFHARPEITSVQPTTIKNIDKGGGNFTVDVTLSSPANSVYRVGLVRASSVTHAWNMNQRYVELVADVFAQDGADVTLLVQPPEDGYVAPLGDYLLSVVEEVPVPQPPGPYVEDRWIPSPGVWVRIVEE